MNKKIAGILAAGTLLSWSNVNAASACSYEKQVELKQSAANIKATYEEAEAEYYDMYTTDENGNKVENAKYNYFEVKFLNLTEDLYLKITNSTNSDIKIVSYADTDEGTYIINWEDLDNVTTFNYSIYTSSNTGCPNELLRKGVVTTPKYNYYYNNPICDGMTDYYLCQKYITSNIDTTQLYKKISSYVKQQAKEEEKQEQQEEEKKNNYGTLIASIVFSVIVCGGGTMLIIAKKRSKKNDDKKSKKNK